MVAPRDQLRNGIESCRGAIGTAAQRAPQAVGTALFAVVAFTGTAAAQSSGGQLCGSPIASLANEFGPLIITALFFGGLIAAIGAHQYAGLKKDPNKAKEVTQWRNRAGQAAVGGPILGWLLQSAVTSMGWATPACMNVLPF